MDQAATLLQTGADGIAVLSPELFVQVLSALDLETFIVEVSFFSCLPVICYFILKGIVALHGREFLCLNWLGLVLPGKWGITNFILLPTLLLVHFSLTASPLPLYAMAIPTAIALAFVIAQLVVITCIMVATALIGALFKTVTPYFRHGREYARLHVLQMNPLAYFLDQLLEISCSWQPVNLNEARL